MDRAHKNIIFKEGRISFKIHLPTEKTINEYNEVIVLKKLVFIAVLFLLSVIPLSALASTAGVLIGKGETKNSNGVITMQRLEYGDRTGYREIWEFDANLSQAVTYNPKAYKTSISVQTSKSWEAELSVTGSVTGQMGVVEVAGSLGFRTQLSGTTSVGQQFELVAPGTWQIKGFRVYREYTYTNCRLEEYLDPVGKQNHAGTWRTIRQGYTVIIKVPAYYDVKPVKVGG